MLSYCDRNGRYRRLCCPTVVGVVTMLSYCCGYGGYVVLQSRYVVLLWQVWRLCCPTVAGMVDTGGYPTVAGMLTYERHDYVMSPAMLSY